MHNPFKALAKDQRFISILKKHRAKKNSPAAPSQAVPEEDLFLQAVADVAPLRQGGRDVALTSGRIGVGPAPLPPKSFAALLGESVEFDLEYSHEYISAQIKGLDLKTIRKLKAGQFSVQDHLDLHGMYADQAKIAVCEFLRRAYLEGHRCVLIIPGRGKNSPLGRGVLRQELSSWLTQAPLKRVVLAFTTALPKHGGAGAIYLLLRQIRKDKGKIIWEDVFADLDG